MRKTTIEVIVIEAIFIGMFIGISVEPSYEFYPSWSKWVAMSFCAIISIGLLIWYAWFKSKHRE